MLKTELERIKKFEKDYPATMELKKKYNTERAISTRDKDIKHPKDYEQKYPNPTKNKEKQRRIRQMERDAKNGNKTF